MRSQRHHCCDLAAEKLPELLDVVAASPRLSPDCVVVVEYAPAEARGAMASMGPARAAEAPKKARRRRTKTRVTRSTTFDGTYYPKHPRLLKRAQLEDERAQAIELENFHLLEKLSRILERPQNPKEQEMSRVRDKYFEDIYD